MATEAVIDAPATTAAPAAPAAPTAPTNVPIAAPLDAQLGVSPTAAIAPVSPPAVASKDDAPGVWPTNWREQYSKEDAKKLEKLQRYQSPEAALDAMFAAQQRISSGELKPVLKKDATPEQLADWRKAHGVPQTPGQYELQGVAIEESEKPMFEELFKSAHETNQSHDQVAATAKAWGLIRAKAFEAQAEKDRSLASSSEDALRAEWGPEYKRNINLVHSLLDGQASPRMKDSLLSGRLADGTPVGSSPAALKMLLGLALINNPTGVVVPGGNANVGQAVADEIASIEKDMKVNRQAYLKDEAKQQRYRNLIEARSKMDGKPLR